MWTWMTNDESGPTSEVRRKRSGERDTFGGETCVCLQGQIRFDSEIV